MSRFDMASKAKLQSRDGGLSKGGLIKNGFTEVNTKNGERWSWQRPALNSHMEAPLTGNGLGLYLVGTDLWGVYSTGGGTAQSQRVIRSTSTSTTAFTLTAGSSNEAIVITTGIELDGCFGYISNLPLGTLVPSTWAGRFIAAMCVATDGTLFQIGASGTVVSNFYERVQINNQTYRMAHASYFLETGGAGGSIWVWPSSPISGVGTYTGFFTK